MDKDCFNCGGTEGVKYFRDEFYREDCIDQLLSDEGTEEE